MGFGLDNRDRREKRDLTPLTDFNRTPHLVRINLINIRGKLCNLMRELIL